MLKTKRYARLWSRVTVVIIVCLTLSLVSCAKKPKLHPPPQMIYVYPPAILLQQCANSPFVGSTFGDAVEALQIKQGELDICSSRIEALIKWQQIIRQDK